MTMCTTPSGDRATKRGRSETVRRLYDLELAAAMKPLQRESEGVLGGPRVRIDDKVLLDVKCRYMERRSPKPKSCGNRIGVVIHTDHGPLYCAQLIDRQGWKLDRDHRQHLDEERQEMGLGPIPKPKGLLRPTRFRLGPTCSPLVRSLLQRRPDQRVPRAWSTHY